MMGFGLQKGGDPSTGVRISPGLPQAQLEYAGRELLAWSDPAHESRQRELIRLLGEDEPGLSRRLRNP